MGWFARSVPWRSPRYWALDLETSGVDPRRAEILSVGMVPIREGRIHWGDRFYRPVRPRRASVGSADTVAAHALTGTELRGAEGLESVLPHVLQRLRDAVLLVHHVRLDVAFIKAAVDLSGYEMPALLVVDTVPLIERYNRRGVWLGREHRPVPLALGAARRYFGLPDHSAHNALADALATAELMLCLRAKLGCSTLRDLGARRR
ncbi:MAG: 3'-5' exonuclease [Nannocystaceae bacterium]